MPCNLTQESISRLYKVVCNPEIMGAAGVEKMVGSKM